jgi:integral membrane protein
MGVVLKTDETKAPEHDGFWPSRVRRAMPWWWSRASAAAAQSVKYGQALKAIWHLPLLCYQNESKMLRTYFSSTVQSLRLLAFWEGTSLLLILFVTMPLKYLAGMPQPNLIVGMAHGILFIGYIALVLLARAEYGMSLKDTFWAMLASVLPFGTFVADSRIFKPLQERIRAPLVEPEARENKRN